MEFVDSTKIRRVDTTAVLLGLPGVVGDTLAAAFQVSGVSVVRVGNLTAACERILSGQAPENADRHEDHDDHHRRHGRQLR